MHQDPMPQDPIPQENGDLDARLESELATLEREMPHLQIRHLDMFALANAWAERYDAILRQTPQELKDEMEARLLRIGIRWGVMPGRRMTQQFSALPPLPPRMLLRKA
jgi:hypothetical protein